MSLFRNHRIFVLLLLLLALAPALEAVKADKEFVIVIDAGHGGHDYGAIGNITNEKTINLAVAKLLGDKIKATGRDIKVVYTRDTDVFIPLKERANIANREKGDLFVSIHVNSLDKKAKNRTTIAGSEVYTLGLHRTEANLAVARRENSVITLEEDYSEKYSGFDPSSAESSIAFELCQSRHLDRSIEFAADAQQQLVTTAKRADKGVRQAGFWVLWATGMPSVLVELDFICNPTSERYLNSQAGRDKLATALCNAVVNYHARITGVPAPHVEDSAEPAEPAEEAAPAAEPAPEAVPTPETAPAQDAEAPAPAPDTFTPAPGQPEWRVQILSSEEELPSSSPKLRGMGGEAAMYRDNGLFKYTIGSYPSVETAKPALRRLRRTFSDAFIIKMIDGKRAQ